MYMAIDELHVMSHMNVLGESQTLVHLKTDLHHFDQIYTKQTDSNIPTTFDTIIEVNC